MASGTKRYKYKTDKGNLFWAVTDDSPDLASIRGTEPTGTPTEQLTLKVSKKSKERGAKPRAVTLNLVVDDTAVGCLIAPNSITKQVVVLSPDTVLPSQGSIITVNGRKYTVGSLTTESFR